MVEGERTQHNHEINYSRNTLYRNKQLPFKVDNCASEEEFEYYLGCFIVFFKYAPELA